MVNQKSSSIAACFGLKCATLFVAASTSRNREVREAEVNAARPRPIPASERKSRRVSLFDLVNITLSIRFVNNLAPNHCHHAASLKDFHLRYLHDVGGENSQ